MLFFINHIISNHQPRCHMLLALFFAASLLLFSDDLIFSASIDAAQKRNVKVVIILSL